jgi:pimeloyl-ACP methyl ester carboxylesterase
METFQAGLDGVTCQSNGCKLVGGLYRGAGVGPRPTAILLHGLPGIEKNLDIAYALREAGWNCLYFHPRGSWGSEGAYSLRGYPDDLRAATEWILQQACADALRLVVIGHSVGGYVALMGGATARAFGGLLLCVRCCLLSERHSRWSSSLNTLKCCMGLPAPNLRLSMRHSPRSNRQPKDCSTAQR